MASNIAFKRNLLNTQTDASGNLGTNPASVIGDNQYVPITLALTQTQRSITGCTLTNTQSKIVGTSGAFDKVRVGDFLTSVSTGSLTAKSAVTITSAYILSGLKEIVFPETYDSSTLGAKAGDAITVASSGTGIPANTVITKIDYANRKIYLNNACTESGVKNLTVTPKIRVTAVRKSTAVSNANEIDFDSTCASSGSNSTLVVDGGATDGVVTVLKITPVDSTTNGNGSIAISAATLDGSLVLGTPAGLNNLGDLSLLNYAALGAYTTNFDKFLVTAGVDSPTS